MVIQNILYVLFFYHWRNRDFTIFKRDSISVNLLLSLTYFKLGNKLTLTVNKLKSELTIPNDFDGKKIVIWLVEDFSQNITKVKISNYSAILSLPSVRYAHNQKFVFRTEDGVLSKIMYSPNFYDDDSEQYHKVLLQEKLNGSYVI